MHAKRIPHLIEQVIPRELDVPALPEVRQFMSTTVER